MHATQGVGHADVGSLFRAWRAASGVTQLELALESGVSSRHISFIETGRARPSRAMVLRLAESLGVPLRDRNALLLAAGFAPAFPERELADADLAPVRRALSLILRRHEPCPAFVLNRRWDILLGNDAHERLLSAILPRHRWPEPMNVMRLVLDPALLRPNIANWPLVAHVLGHRIRKRWRSPHLPATTRTLLGELLELPDVEEAMRTRHAPPESAILIPLELSVGGRRTAWFSMIATIGSPRDVTLDELQIESLFPADDATERLARELAAERANGEASRP